MVNFLNEANKRLANRIENLKTIEEKNTAELAVAFQLFKLVTEKGKIVATNDPLYNSIVRNSAYTLNELVVVDVSVISNYADKFLSLKDFRFENQVDTSNNVGELFGTGLVEINRGETISNFRKWKATKYLGYEPLYVWDSAVKEKVSTSYRLLS